MEKPKIVYLVDDDEDERYFLREAIDALDQQIKVVEAGNGKDLLELLHLQNLDANKVVVLLDFNMPRVNGMEALAAMKNDEHTCHVPTAMISICSDPSVIRQSYDAGINIFIKKPSTMDGFKKIAAGLHVCFFS